MHVEFSMSGCSHTDDKQLNTAPGLWRKPDQEAWLGKYVYPGNPTTMSTLQAT